MKKLLFLISLLAISSPAFAYNYIYNPHTSRFDAVGAQASGDVALVCDSGNVLTSQGSGTWACAPQTGGSGLFTDDGAITYLTSTTDDVAIGGSTTAAPFFMDVSEGNLGLGAGNYGDILTGLEVTKEAESARMILRASASATAYYGYTANNTLASPTAVADADILVGLFGGGYDGASWRTGGAMVMQADDIWSSGNFPTDIYWQVSSGSSLSQVMTIKSNRRLGFGADMSPDATFEVDFEGNGGVFSGFTSALPVARFSNTSTATLADGTTIASWPNVFIDAPRMNGVVGGGTETITDASTLYIEGPPSGTNITFTNGPYSLWVDAGTARFDGNIDTALTGSRCIETDANGRLTVAASTCGTSSSAPFVDTTSIVEGSADATKEIRFEVDGLTTSTVRVITPPDKDFTMIASGDTFDGDVTGTLDTDGSTTLTIADSRVEVSDINFSGTPASDDIALYPAAGDQFTPTSPAELLDKTFSSNGYLRRTGAATYDIGTTSANLRSDLSDESGTGAAIFAGGDIGAGTATKPAADDDDTSIPTTSWVQDELLDQVHKICSMTLIEPDQIQTVQDAVTCADIDAGEYPFGVTITEIVLTTDAASSCSYNVEEWTDTLTATGASSTIDAIATSSSSETRETTITDASVAAGNFIRLDLDTCDVNEATLTVYGKGNLS